MKRTSVILLTAVLFTACSNQNSHNEAPEDSDTMSESRVATGKEHYQTSNPTSDSMQNGEGNGNVSPRKADEKVRLVVSFISQGEGIDRKTNEAFVAWVKQKGNITYDANNWGREGEINYCFALDNLSPAEQDKFVEEARAQLNVRPLVKFNENTSCENWK